MAPNIFSKEFLKDATVRGIRTFCQTLGSVLGGSALDVWTVGWHSAVGVAAGSALISFLMTVDRYTAFVDNTVDTAVDTTVENVTKTGRRSSTGVAI